jgi:DNA-binding response OmpR family regulator
MIALTALLEASDGRCRCIVSNDVDEFRGRLLEDRCEVVLVAQEDLDLSLAEDFRRLQPHGSLVVAAPTVDVDGIRRAMQFGATDFLSGPMSAEEVERRIDAAARRSRERVEHEERMHRLRSLSRRLEAETRPVDDLEKATAEEQASAGSPTDDTAPATPFEGDADQVRKLDEVAMCSEFRTLIRQELDVEDLLRTALEYLLVKTGPTNAAVYLAGGDDSFGLGAYVNCDLPRKSVEPMLRRLCDEACPAVAEHVDVLRFEDAKEFVSDCELGAEVSEDIEMVAVPCHHDGECFAVMFLFRDSEQGFEDETAQVLGALRSILAEQLATLIRVHNRLENGWPDAPADEETDEDLGWDDLAA